MHKTNPALLYFGRRQKARRSVEGCAWVIELELRRL